MSLEIKILKGILSKGRIIDDFAESGIEKGDIVLLIDKDPELPMSPLLAEFNEMAGLGPGYISFNAENCIYIDDIESVADLILPKIRRATEEKINYVADTFYFGNKERIIRDLESENLIRYRD